MGIAQNSILGLVGTAGVAASKMSHNIGKGPDQQGQSQANNAQLNQQAFQKSMQNMNDLKGLKKQINGIWKDKNLTERQKVLKINKTLDEKQGGGK